jgi:hypothetical protein
LNDAIDSLDRQTHTRVSLVAWLASRLAARWRLGWKLRSAGWVGRWRQ